MQSSLVPYLRMLLFRRDKIILLGLLFFAIFISLVETASISLIMPFISVATNFDLLTKNAYFGALHNLSGSPKPATFVIALGIVLIIFYALRGLLNIIFTYALNRFAQGRFHVIALRFFKNYLRCNYRYFISKHSEAIRKVIIMDAAHFTQIVTGILNIFSELFTVVCIYAMLFFVNWKMTLVLSGLFVVKLIFLIRPFFARIALQSRRASNASVKIHMMFSEAFGNFKLIKFLGNEQYILRRFDEASFNLSRAKSLSTTFQALPRLILETLGFFVLVGVIVYVVYQYNDATFVMPIVSMYAIAFYRFLPSINKILSSYNQVIDAKSSMNLFQDDLASHVERLGNQSIQFKTAIRWQHVLFGYEPGKPVLKNLNLAIEKNTSVAFVGESGCGKSTLLDVLSGLYLPQQGEIFIDDMPLTNDSVKSWRMKIGYIPQDVYLFDGTVAENIVFGRTYDEQRIVIALKQANIYEYLLTKEGIHTVVGERGVRFSGGQKQRIAIARALYLDPEVLILDEATSALDMITESKIMDEIYASSANKTLIIVAHRLSTVSRCNKIYRFEHGSLREVDFASIMTSHETQGETTSG